MLARVELPRIDSPEFALARQRVHTELAIKFAWTAQYDGMIYREAPASMKPMDDKTFNRISRVHHSFWYLDSKGHPQHYFLRMDDILVAMDDPSLDTSVTITEMVEFMPGKPRVYKDDLLRSVLNIWKAPRWEDMPTEAEPTVFLDHVAYLFDGDEQAANHLLDFAAHLVQRPSERVNHAVLLTSEAKGIGKSTLGLILRRLVGERNSGVAQSKDLKSQFDGWLLGKLVLQVDEVYESGNVDVANKLKPILTEPTVSVNIKYGPQMTVQNFARLILFSNHSSPIEIEEGDRRYFIFDSKATPRPQDYYDQLNAFIQSDGGMSAIYWWLKRRSLTSFAPYAAPPSTSHKQAAIEASGGSLRHYVVNSIQSGHFFTEMGAEFSIDQVQRLLAKDGYGQQAKNDKELGQALKAAGVTDLRPMVNGKRQRLKRLPEWAIEPTQATEF